MPPLLSIVLPCYNEAPGLPKLLDAFAKAVGEHPVEVILVNNGSSDETADVLQELAPQYPFLRVHTVVENQGYGHGIFLGLLQAQGTYIGWTHGDLQCPPADVIRALSMIKASPHPDRTLVKGNRLGRSFNELVITRGMEVVATMIMRRRISEINAQPKIFHRSLMARLTNPPKDFSLDVYTLEIARRGGWRVFEFDVQFPPRVHGTSHWANSLWNRLRTIKTVFCTMYRLGAGIL